MVKKNQPTSVNQSATGTDNIQVAGSNNVVNRITNFITGDTETQRTQRNRRAMLELVKNTWIKGVLEKSLYNEVLIELGLEERPRAVEHPWDVQVQMPGQTNRILPLGSSIIDIFDEMNGAMLILGEPGSGKTTMLLELTRDCIARAEQDDTQPIPVVFNLSSWNDKQSIDDWLVNELRTKYNVPRKIAQDWVENDVLQLLLDGLDEVKLENRETCVRVINEFRQEHGLTVLIAVCSRIADYEALTLQLNLQSAVLLQPLTPKQLDEYFEQAGSDLERAHQILRQDDVLQELVKQPLMLSVMTLAYRGASTEILGDDNLGTIETRRRRLFDTYIQQMFERAARTKNEPYPHKQTKEWLGWLAKLMLWQNQSIFHIELLQPVCLPSALQRYLVTTGPAIISGSIVGLIVWSIVQSGTGLDIGPLIGVFIGSVFGSLVKSEHINPIEALNWSWLRIIAMLKGILRLGLILGLIGPLVGVLFGGVNGLFVGVVWSATWLMIILLLGLFIGPFIGLVKKEIATRSVPNEGIHRSFRSALISWIIFGLHLGLVFGLLGGAIGGIYGVLVGGCVGLWFGGVACLQHIILRALLQKNHAAPWNYIRFLDYCTDRIFLRKVGGGYIFVHRLLMEHFAAMYPESEK